MIDLFCGEGGCSMGYHRAGFDVVGVDIRPQPRYPFAFIQEGALEVMEVLLTGEVWYEADRAYALHDFAAIHASPPCQSYSAAMRHLHTRSYPMLIDAVRESLVQTGMPWVIENVPGSPLPVQDDLFGAHGVELCGSMFGLAAHGLQIRRHRLFEASFPIAPPRGCDHRLPSMNPHNADARELIFAVNGRDDPERLWRKTMGVEWMGIWEGREAVPPAYTEHIGRALLSHLGERAA